MTPSHPSPRLRMSLVSPNAAVFNVLSFAAFPTGAPPATRCPAAPPRRSPTRPPAPPALPPTPSRAASSAAAAPVVGGGPVPDDAAEHAAGEGDLGEVGVAGLEVGEEVACSPTRVRRSGRERPLSRGPEGGGAAGAGSEGGGSCSGCFSSAGCAAASPRASPSASAAAAPPLLSPPPSRAPAAAPAAPRSPRAPSSPPSPACPCPAPPPPPVPCRPPVAARGGAPRRRRWRAGPSVCLPFFAWRWWTKFQQCARHHLRRRLHVGRQELHEAGRLVGGRRAVPRRQRRGGGLGDWRGVG
jgi:hypothetical protein